LQIDVVTARGQQFVVGALLNDLHLVHGAFAGRMFWTYRLPALSR
jgi:hypothetical protein